jgi:hypothetical protein
MESEEFNSFFSPGDNGGKILIEDDSENRGGKSGVGEIIHRPPEDLAFLNGHHGTYLDCEQGMSYDGVSREIRTVP